MKYWIVPILMWVYAIALWALGIAHLVTLPLAIFNVVLGTLMFIYCLLPWRHHFLKIF